MKRVLLAVVVLAAGLAVIACQDQKRARVYDNGANMSSNTSYNASNMSSNGWNNGRTFNVNLKPSENVTDSSGAGNAWFNFSRDNNSVQYRLSSQDLTSNVTSAHIHLGKPGTEGTPVVTLFSGLPKQATGQFSSGSFTRNDLTGPLSGKDISDLMQEIRNNNAYVNVHTEKYPQGEIRGQMTWQTNDGMNLNSNSANP